MNDSLSCSTTGEVRYRSCVLTDDCFARFPFREYRALFPVSLHNVRSKPTDTDRPRELDGRATSFKMEYQPDPSVQAMDPWSEVYLVIIPSS
jgi:hypothetical protein